jgi:dCTP deaminase
MQREIAVAIVDERNAFVRESKLAHSRQQSQDFSGAGKPPGQETHVDTERPLDQGTGHQAPHDRAVQRKAGGGGVISYGLSSYGYDLRVSDEFKIFTNVNSAIIDPKAFDERSFVSVQAESVIVPPNSFAWRVLLSTFVFPRDVLTICVGKSTYARCGIIVNVTPFEPEWEGFVTLEISNTTPLPAKVYANEGLCQILFFRSDEPARSAMPIARANIRSSRELCFPSAGAAGRAIDRDWPGPRR